MGCPDLLDKGVQSSPRLLERGFHFDIRIQLSCRSWRGHLSRRGRTGKQKKTNHKNRCALHSTAISSVPIPSQESFCPRALYTFHNPDKKIKPTANICRVPHHLFPVRCISSNDPSVEHYIQDSFSSCNTNPDDAHAPNWKRPTRCFHHQTVQPAAWCATVPFLHQSCSTEQYPSQEFGRLRTFPLSVLGLLYLPDESKVQKKLSRNVS